MFWSKETIGWKLLFKWKNGSKSWILFKLAKESNPTEVAEFFTSRKIADEPEFAWWDPYVLRNHDRIISSINPRVQKATHKFGIKIQTSYADCKRPEKYNGNTFRIDALKKEMKDVGIAFKILEEDEHLPVGYKKSSEHIIFTVNMDFTCKDIWVKDGHSTKNPTTPNYAEVVSRESIHILLNHAAVHRLSVKSSNTRNAYIQDPTYDKHYIICRPEFGIENEGKQAVIV